MPCAFVHGALTTREVPGRYGAPTANRLDASAHCAAPPREDDDATPPLAHTPCTGCLAESVFGQLIQLPLLADAMALSSPSRGEQRARTCPQLQAAE